MNLRAGQCADSASVSRLAKIAPNTETPMEPPICWKNNRELLATPMSFSSTLFCAISEVVCMSRPMPSPSTTKNSPEVTRVVATPSIDSRNMPTPIPTEPATGSIL